MKASIKHIETINAPTRFGMLKLALFQNSFNDNIIVLFKENNLKRTYLRIHSSCIYSETFELLNCDCKEQLRESIKYIANKGGFLIYLEQEGRGHGLKYKTKEIRLQQSNGLDTYEASRHLGLNEDDRKYTDTLNILKYFNINTVLLNTNNFFKYKTLIDNGINVKTKITKSKMNEFNAAYLKEKTLKQAALWTSHKTKA